MLVLLHDVTDCTYMAVTTASDQAGEGLARALSTALPGGSLRFLPPGGPKLAPPTPINRFRLDGGNFVRHVVQTGKGLQKTARPVSLSIVYRYTTGLLDRQTEQT